MCLARLMYRSLFSCVCRLLVSSLVRYIVLYLVISLVRYACMYSVFLCGVCTYLVRWFVRYIV